MVLRLRQKCNFLTYMHSEHPILPVKNGGGSIMQLGSWDIEVAREAVQSGWMDGWMERTKRLQTI